jgi:hypothetical protein
MDFHTFDDHVETDPDNTDLEHITNIHSHTHKYTQIYSNTLKFKYPRTALLLPQKYQKEALCEAHKSILGGHNAKLKTYM